MITYTQGNLLDAQAEALVNAVNTVGVMGKGIALQFRHQFPENYKAYKDAVDQGELTTGKVQVVPIAGMGKIKYIVNFPTKQHWRSPSKILWIKEGLADLCAQIINYHISSIALPALGCGNGGLDWAVVKPIMEQYLSNLNADIIIYEPTAFVQETAKKETKMATPKLAPAKAMFLCLLYQYQESGKPVTEAVATALGYFLQRFGETQLKFKFTKDAQSLRSNEVSFLLYSLNETYLEGYEQVANNPAAKLELRASAQQEVEQQISNTLLAEEKQRLHQVTALIQPVKTNEGLLLLALVDYLMNTENISDEAALYEKLQSGRSLPIEHVRAAVKYLSKIKPGILDRQTASI
ncbi:macro domain-containing protein [Mucilaginibacter robiniae]|uniref:Macro domain-containing protein n=1 Tax=Mucilaginibacter robiniae TaxID=2728022 RepID=A0A7L5DZ67_9SPHI|nr:macro domain-containing protein [Mucilaginibacter robiniae]QJD96390.1 macro domain-containing protein [Mucilaginibacter robiniae]